MGTISGLARIAALGAVLALAGCVTAENSLSQNDIAGMKLAGVTVGFAPEAGDPVGGRHPGLCHLQGDHRRRDRDRDQHAGGQGVRSEHAGAADQGRASNRRWPASSTARGRCGSRSSSRALRLPSAVQRILIGGGRGMVADANLVDARTGALILAYPDMHASRGGRETGSSERRSRPRSTTRPREAPPRSWPVVYGENYRDLAVAPGVV